jgi:hypothetical protein
MTSHTKSIKNSQILQLEITQLKHHITYGKSAMNIKCMLHFSQLLFETFAAPINI